MSHTTPLKHLKQRPVLSGVFVVKLADPDPKETSVGRGYLPAASISQLTHPKKGRSRAPPVLIEPLFCFFFSVEKINNADRVRPLFCLYHLPRLFFSQFQLHAVRRKKGYRALKLGLAELTNEARRFVTRRYGVC